MAQVNKSLSSIEFLAVLAKTIRDIGGIPFVFDAESDSGKLFLEKIKALGLNATKEEISKVIPKFFLMQWGPEVVNFSKFPDGRFQVSLSPDKLAIDLSSMLSERARTRFAARNNGIFSALVNS